MSQNLLELLRLPGHTQADRIYGVVIGIVTNNKDPDRLGRVKVRFPWLSASDESWWARVATTMAGKERGTYFLPEVDDEVLLAFEHGDVRFPYVLGALWNGEDRPPETNDDGKNNKRTIRSRSGHIIRLDDSDGGEKIEIIDKTGKDHISFDATARTITVQAESDIRLESVRGNVIIRGQAIDIKSTAQDVTIEAAISMDVKAAAQMNIQGTIVNIN